MHIYVFGSFLTYLLITIRNTRNKSNLLIRKTSSALAINYDILRYIYIIDNHGITDLYSSTRAGESVIRLSVNSW